MPTNIEGTIAVEGQPTGDGRLIDANAIRWDDVLPVPLVDEHDGPAVGSIVEVERRQGGIIWASATLDTDSDDPETARRAGRIAELLEDGAVGASVALDDEVVELRVRKDAADMTEPEDGPDDTMVVARFDRGDQIEALIDGRLRHVAVVTTAADPDNRLSVAAALFLAGGFEHAFADPQFGEPGIDDRLRYDPHGDRWSVPVTVEDDGRVFGHIAPHGLCLRGRPDRCVTPPDGDLRGFMRHRAPFAGGLNTGVITLGGKHAATGVGAAQATRHYDATGRGIADVIVGNDRYGVWFAGMLRPGVKDDDMYALAASDVSGHWEPGKNGQPVLCGLLAVNVGGFPKGYLTAAEVNSGLAAAAEVQSVAASCGCGGSCDSSQADSGGDAVAASLARIEAALAPIAAQHAARQVRDF